MKTHIQIAAILNIAAGVLYFLTAAIVSSSWEWQAPIAFSQGEHEAAGIVGIVAVAVTCFLALLGLPSVIGGWALLAGKTWTRPVVLVLAVLHLPNFPLGSALGIYTIWALFRHEPQASMPVPAMHPAM
jgi:hypothetical protein